MPDQRTLVTRRRFRLRLGELFRVQAGAAILLAVVLVVDRLAPERYSRSVSPLAFILVTSTAAWTTYVASRRFFSRFTSPLLAVLSAGILGGAFTRLGTDNPAELAVLGMCVALSWVVGAGWLDSGDNRPAGRPQT
ncbi:MAG TPA: hypothetical protein VG826_18850 [Pirellulales bacterium]|nr:hypothetical protein [Pirellulales bacterium]